MRSILCFIGLCLVSLCVTAQIGSLAEHAKVTWELDPTASTYNPGKVRKSDVRTYTIDGIKVHMDAKVVFQDGKEIEIHYDAAYDGKDYPVAGNPKVQTIALERVDARTTKTVTKRNGKVTAHGMGVVSADGQTLKVHSSGTDEDGIAYDDTLVFHRRK